MWDGAEKTQRMVLIGGTGFLVLLFAGIIFFASRPHMSLLFGGLNASEQGSVVAELDKDGIPTEFNERGDILVPSNLVAQARVRLASANKLPSTTAFGDQAFAGLGVMNTPPVERERLKAILEGKLAETIESIDGVASARVQLVMPEDSAFVRDQKPATASVTVSEKGSAELDKNAGHTIALLVSNSVPGLDITHVNVINSEMKVLYDGSDNSSVGGKIDQRLETERAEGRQIENSLQTALDQVYGPNSTIVKVNLELDYDDKSYVEEKNVPSDKLTTAQVDETMDGGGSLPVGGAAGASSNTFIGAPATASGGTGGKKYTMSQKQIDYLKDTTKTQVSQAPGSIKTETIDVMANSDKVKDTSQIQQIVDGFLGSKVGTPGFTSTVTAVQFDKSGADAATKAAASEAMQQRIQQVISILPILALGIVAFMVIKQLGKFNKSSMVALADSGAMAFPVPANFGSTGGGQASIGSGGGSSAGFGGSEFAESSATGGSPFSIEEADSDEQRVRIKAIGTKVNVPLEQIKRMSEERPEAVAMLIKGWLMEEN